jgi:hypothetical protein
MGIVIVREAGIGVKIGDNKGGRSDFLTRLIRIE